MDALEVSSTRRCCRSGPRCNRAELIIVQTCRSDSMMADVAGWPPLAGSGPAGYQSADAKKVNPPHGDAAVGRGLTVWSCSHRMVSGPTRHREAGRGGRDRIRTTWAGYDGSPGAGRLRCQHLVCSERTPGRGWGNEDIHASGHQTARQASRSRQPRVRSPGPVK